MAQHFRAGVVIVVRHPDGKQLLAFERSDSPDSWQLPQGGLDTGEEPIEGAWRELFEETGLGEDHVIARAEYPDWVAYEWPADVMLVHGKDGKRRGQVQKWFLFDALHADIEARYPLDDAAAALAHQVRPGRHGKILLVS